MSTSEYNVHVASGPGAPHAKDHRQRHVVVELLDADRYLVTVDGDAQIVSARKVETAGASTTWSIIQIAGGQIAGGQIAGGQIAGGQIAGGQIAGGQIADGQVAAGGAASGPQRVVDVDVAGEDLRVTVGGGEPLFVQVHDLRDRRVDSDQSAAAGSGELRAAMPGKVVKLLSKVGDTVKAGQSLLVIEAMKMENELRSPGAGQIAEIAVREGQTVEAGQLLVALAAG